MDRKELSNKLRLRFIAPLARASLYILALVGLFWLIGGPLLKLVISPLFVTEVVRSFPSPDGSAVAEIEVRKGGFGTVWTTRVHLNPNGADYWTVYQTKGNEFVPPIRWADRETLVVGLPCYRFDHVSNPDDWERSDPSERRLKVRFTYPEECPLLRP